MGKIDYFNITLDKSTAYYFGGELLSGRIDFRVNKRLKINDVHVDIIGESRVHWTETRTTGSGKNRRTYTVHYRNNEIYLSTTVIFLSKQNISGGDLYLEFGDYSYPFQIQLPPNLPPSFQHHIGKIRYYVRGTIDIPWAFDKHAERHFTVINNLDLNQDPGLAIAQHVEGQKILCCWPCESDPIIGTLNIMKGGFVPGESIRFKVTIDNQSNRQINLVAVKLLQHLEFHATRKSKSDRREVAILHYGNQIGSKENQTWDGSLRIPPVCNTLNTCTTTCSIIELNYYLSLYFDVSTMSMSKDFMVPVRIGTVPIRENNIVDSIIEDPVPSYESCIYGRNSTVMPSEDNGRKGEILNSDETSFAPMYTYYKFD